jgi:hypothetical protein
MSGQAAAGGNTIRWQVQATSITQLQAAWQAALGTALAHVGEIFAQAARQAYQGTRFAPAFTLHTQTTPIHRITLVQTHPLFVVVEYPTRPHTIRPRNGRFLVFTVGGRRVFARSVSHPGTKGRLAIDPIFQQAEQAFTDALIRATGEMIRRA